MTPDTDALVALRNLVSRIESAHDLHATFTIKDSPEFASALTAAQQQPEKQGNDAEIASAVREAAKLEGVSAEMLVSVIRGEYRSAVQQAGEFVVVRRELLEYIAGDLHAAAEGVNDDIRKGNRTLLREMQETYGMDWQALRHLRIRRNEMTNTPKQGAEPVENLAYELDGVIADIEKGGGFDYVCLQTIKRVRDALAVGDTASPSDPEKGAEPVAAQQRFRHPQKTMPDWSIWQPAEISKTRPNWTIDSQGYEVEYRLLYTASPSDLAAGMEMARRIASEEISKYSGNEACALHVSNAIRAAIPQAKTVPNYDRFGYALAMRVLQSDLYHQLDERERAECDELIASAIKE